MCIRDSINRLKWADSGLHQNTHTNTHRVTFHVAADQQMGGKVDSFSWPVSLTCWTTNPMIPGTIANNTCIPDTLLDYSFHNHQPANQCPKWLGKDDGNYSMAPLDSPKVGEGWERWTCWNVKRSGGRRKLGHSVKEKWKHLKKDFPPIPPPK